MPTRFDLAYYCLLPAALPFFLYRRLARGKYHESARGMLGRDLPRGAQREVFRNGSVWLHAVSVGETVAAKSIAPFLHELAPGLPLVATTITETGQAHARQILTEAGQVHYYPLDFSWNVRNFLDCFNPRVFIMMETELWPNFLTLAAARGCRVFMVNGKLSDRSFGRYRAARALLRPAFEAIRAFCMQTEGDAEKMRQLCGRPQDVHVTGNCKFDAPMPPLDGDVQQFVRKEYLLGETRRPLFVVGSTHPGEEEIVLRAFEETRRAVPGLQMILSPRHPERFREVYELCRNHPAGWKVSRATAPRMESPDIFVLDKMGELARIYGLGDVAVVAGSFCRIGGHNVLEAAAHSIPVVVGPHMHAQKELDRLFQASDSGCVRCDADNLGRTLAELFRDEVRRREIGALARHTATRNQGSARKSIEILKRYL
jgi:3-deoxy-D-manno-octulosonic-acid transferase